VSPENVELVRRGRDAFARGDWAALAEGLDADVLIRGDRLWPEQRVYGRDAAVAFYRGIWESITSDIRLQDIMDLGDRVLTRVRMTVHGSRSGLDGELRYSTVRTIRDGRIILEEYFLDHDEALKAVGLEG
jgi:ketosteroid isomerase-like protein